MICVTFTSFFAELAFVVGNLLMSIDFNVAEMFGSWIYVKLILCAGFGDNVWNTENQIM